MIYPILYSFRRCPYAMRARMAMAYSKISYEHREILLNDRPKSLYDLSRKGTVPVLKLMDGTVIDESIDMMKWCIQQNDLNDWYKDECSLQDNMIKNNDNEFKYWLDRYKYHVRYEENSYEAYQNNVKNFFSHYNLILQEQSFFLGDQISLVDIALMPFVRQGAHVDLNWFSDNFPFLFDWLENLKAQSLFLSIMTKFEIWNENSKGHIVAW